MRVQLADVVSLKVAVVGTSLQAGVLAPALNDSAPEELDVRTVPDAASAKHLISERTISAVAGRLHVLWQLALAAVTSAIVAGIGVIVAGPIYQVIDHELWATWLMAWLYCAAIKFIGVGLHPVLRRWTTPILTLLFVMLNFTSSGGIYTADFVPPFFAALGSFWNGAALIHAVQTVTYFPGQEYWSDLVTLGSGWRLACCSCS